MICYECGREFEYRDDDEWSCERDVCYECERELMREHAPELLGDEE